MIVCDRCGATSDLRRFTLHMEPRNPQLRGELDLCRACEEMLLPRVQEFVRKFLNSRSKAKVSNG